MRDGQSIAKLEMDLGDSVLRVTEHEAGIPARSGKIENLKRQVEWMQADAMTGERRKIELEAANQQSESPLRVAFRSSHHVTPRAPTRRRSIDAPSEHVQLLVHSRPDSKQPATRAREYEGLRTCGQPPISVASPGGGGWGVKYTPKETRKREPGQLRSLASFFEPGAQGGSSSLPPLPKWAGESARGWGIIHLEVKIFSKGLNHPLLVWDFERIRQRLAPGRPRLQAPAPRPGPRRLLQQ